MSKDHPSSVSVESQIRVIRVVAILEIVISIIIVVSQTIAIGSSYEFATRSLTGIWTSWFFFMAAGLALFWSARCTFNGLLTVLVLQIIAATMTIPLFTACSIVIGVYDFRFSTENEAETSLVGSSITILTTNLIMIFASIIEMILNAYNAYNCYFLAYGGQQRDNYDRRSMRSSISTEGNHEEVETQNMTDEQDEKPHSGRNAAQPNLSSKDIRIIKCAGVTGLLLAFIIFCCQIAMFVLAQSNGISIGIGIWGALYYAATGLVTLYAGFKASSQSTVAVFVLQIVQFILSVPLVGIAFYIVAVFGSCIQINPLPECGQGSDYGKGLAVSIMGGIMALSGMVQGMVSLVLILICSQSVCGVRCMISGATVYPSM
ncbi:unnamed protein product [Allacma fusca]|uniref:Uncharacterized protein n=1 Tax=Allacma fusca TaxID=39272 RepID=A0A8J2PJU5_9HEXA|nr:unnamed protein product [Allacma fusca]